MTKTRYYRPSLINLILGRKLACGDRPWYVKAVSWIHEYVLLWIRDWFRFYILRRQWYVTMEEQDGTFVHEVYGLTYEMAKILEHAHSDLVVTISKDKF